LIVPEPADDSSGHSLRRLPRGQSFDQAIRQGAQSIQCSVSFSCTEAQLFCDIFSAFVVTTVRKNAASFLQGNFHLGDRSFIDPAHETSQTSDPREAASGGMQQAAPVHPARPQQMLAGMARAPAGAFAPGTDGFRQPAWRWIG
jgi:hypothetical protein